MEVSPLYSALAGMSVNAQRLAVAANNIANINTDSYKSSSATIESGPGGQPQTQITQSTTSGALIANPEGLPEGAATRELSNVELSNEFVQMKISEYGYKANISVIRTQDEMVGTILDILA